MRSVRDDTNQVQIQLGLNQIRPIQVRQTESIHEDFELRQLDKPPSYENVLVIENENPPNYATSLQTIAQ
jgi:hypothetical protein